MLCNTLVLCGWSVINAGVSSGCTRNSTIPKNPKWAERIVVLAIECSKVKAFHIFIHFFCAIIGVSYTENPGFTLKNPKWAERVVVLANRRRKCRAFQIWVHFYCAIIEVLYAELKIIKVRQWIWLSKRIMITMTQKIFLTNHTHTHMCVCVTCTRTRNSL